MRHHIVAQVNPIQIRKNHNGISSITAAIVVIAILVVGIAAGLSVTQFTNQDGPSSQHSSSIDSSISTITTRSSQDASTSTFGSSSSTSNFVSESSDSTSSSSSRTLANGSNYSIFLTNDSSRAGYEAIIDSNYSLVSINASWVVPFANCNNVSANQQQVSSMWIGIEDDRTNELEQIATNTGCIGQTPSYDAEYEFFPELPIYLGQVSAGDLIRASVYYSLSTKNYTLTISDQTEEWTKSATGSGGGDYQADWVVEDPQGPQGYFLLSNFGSVTFFNCTMTVVNSTGRVVLAPIDYHDYLIESNLIGISDSKMLASVSPLSYGGTSFTATWENSE
jgi:hypothetical protein